MTNLHKFLTLSAFLALAGTTAAFAAPIAPGEYKLTVSHGAPCSLTLAADKTATLSACAHLQNVSHWSQSAGNIELGDGAGAVYAVLHANGDGYAGNTILDNRSLTLAPAQTATTR